MRNGLISRSSVGILIYLTMLCLAGLVFTLTGNFLDYVVNVITSCIFLFVTVAVIEHWLAGYSEKRTLLSNARRLCDRAEFSNDDAEKYRALDTLSTLYWSGELLDLPEHVMGGLRIRHFNLNDRTLQFRAVSMEKIRFDHCNLKGIVLAACNLTDAEMTNETDLDGADLSLSRLNRAYLRKVNLANANLDSTHLAAAQLQGANLKGASLVGAELNSPKFGHVQIDVKTIFPDGSRGHLDWKDLTRWTQEQAYQRD